MQKKPAHRNTRKRIESLVYCGTGDEGYELFQATCSFCYKLTGLGFSEEAATVCGWAEEMAAASVADPDADPGDTAKGHWG